MKHKLSVVGIILVVFGAVIGSVWANIPLAQLSGFAVTMFGAGLAVADLWQNRAKDTKPWVNVLSISLVGAGAFLCGITNVIAEEMMVQIIGYAVSLALLLAGIITNVFAKKK